LIKTVRIRSVWLPWAAYVRNIPCSGSDDSTSDKHESQARALYFNRQVNLSLGRASLTTEKLCVSSIRTAWPNPEKPENCHKDSKDQIINDVIKSVVNDLRNNKLIAPK